MTGTTIHIPTLETERLRLRAPGPADFEAFAAFRGSARARTVGGPYSREEAFEQLGALIGQAFDGTVAPLAGGYFFAALIALVMTLIAEKGRLFRSQNAPV